MFRKISSVVLLSFCLVPVGRAQWVNDVDRLPKSGSGSAQGVDQDEDRPDQAQKWFYDQRAFGLGYIPKDGLSKARVAVNAMRSGTAKGSQSLSVGKFAAATSVPWTLVGPSNIGGRVNTIAIDPKDANTAYLGAANGGIWKTTNGGTSWEPLTDQMQSLAMGALAIDPQNTKTIYAGTGEFAAAIDAYSGFGLLRSTDGGHSWSSIGPLNVAAYSRIVVNPKHSNIIYAAGARSGGGVLRSTDNGSHWDRLSNGLTTGEVTDLAVAMNGDAAVIYAGVANSGIYRSMNGGDTWDKVLPNNGEWSEMRRIHVDVMQSNYKQVAAMSVNRAGDMEGIEISNDGGSTWQAGGSLPSQLFGNNSQGWYDAYLRLDQTNFDHLLAGGISVWQSQDGGASWNDVGIAYQPGGIHPDQHEAQFAPSDPSVVYIGNDGGLFISHDGGSSFTTSTSPLPITEFYGIGIAQDASDVTYGGTQDNGSLLGGATTDWSSFDGGDGSYTLVDPNKSGRVYLANTQGTPYRFEDGILHNIGYGISQSDKLLWLNPFGLDPKNDIVYFGTQNLYYSTNHGATWIRRPKSLTKDTTANIDFIEPFGDGVTVLCATSAGQLFLTTDNGKNFTNVSKGLPGRAITCTRFDPSSKSIYYVTLSGYGAGHVFKTTDNGSSWANISSTLPDVPVNSLMLDPTNPKALYLGTDVGVFFSPNGGDVWLPYGTGLPNVAVVYMDIHKANRILRVGTHGRSIWEAPLVSDIAGIATPGSHTLWIMGDTGNIAWHGFSGKVMVELSRDQGAHWTLIAKDVEGTTYSIPSIQFGASENALVRISDASQSVTSPLFQIVQRQAGTSLKVLAELPIYLYDIAYDPDLNVLWGTDFNAADTKIYKLDADNGKLLDSVNLGANHGSLTGIKYDVKTKHLFIHQAFETGTSNIFEVTKSGQTVRQIISPSQYGTGILVHGDTLYAADRLTSKVHRALVSDLDFSLMNDLEFSRAALYGPRGIAFNPRLTTLMMAYTNFQGTNSQDATLDGSYMLFLNPVDGTETKSFIMQEGISDGVNIRGLEYDPRNGGNTAWVTTLGAGTSAKLVKVTLMDGPNFPDNSVVNSQLPVGYALGANYPNPVNPSTTIPYSIGKSGNVELRLLDPMGRVAYSDVKHETAGDHYRLLDLSSLPSGNYVYELRLDGLRIASKKMTLLK